MLSDDGTGGHSSTRGDVLRRHRSDPVRQPRNRLDDAIAHLRRVVEINPLNADAYQNLAVAYGLQGRIDAAIAAAQAAVRLKPESTAARDQLQRLLGARSR